MRLWLTISALALLTGCTNPTEQPEPEKRVEREKEGPRRDVLEYMSLHLDLAFAAYEKRQFLRARKLMNCILAVAPDYVVAIDLIQSCDESEAVPSIDESLFLRNAAWGSFAIPELGLGVPFADSIRTPSEREWRDITGFVRH